MCQRGPPPPPYPECMSRSIGGVRLRLSTFDRYDQKMRDYDFLKTAPKNFEIYRIYTTWVEDLERTRRYLYQTTLFGYALCVTAISDGRVDIPDAGMRIVRTAQVQPAYSNPAIAEE